MKRVATLARHPAIRGSFAVIALGLAVWAVARDWDAVSAALAMLPWWATVGAGALSLGYVIATMESWRVVMAALTHPLPWGDAARIFLVSQVGKYIPGGVWNVVAGAELARDRGVSRARTAAALALTMLVSILTGVALGAVGAAVAPHGLPWWVRLAGIAAPVAMAALWPSLLTRLLIFALTRLRREPLSTPLTWRHVSAAAAWAVAAWTLAGAQVWVLAIGLGLQASAGTAMLAIGGFAVAWIVGFAVLVLPSGLGARELVLFPVFGAALSTPAILAMVLMSRVLFTVADVVLAVVPLVARRRRDPLPDVALD